MVQRLVIEVLAGPGVGESQEFDIDRVLIGRGSQCDLRIASPHVSRQQCEVIRQADQFVLENLGSVNVTYLNDRPIEREAVLGNVVALAEHHGIAVPHLNTVLVTLRMRAALEGRA